MDGSWRCENINGAHDAQNTRGAGKRHTYWKGSWFNHNYTNDILVAWANATGLYLTNLTNYMADHWTPIVTINQPPNFYEMNDDNVFVNATILENNITQIKLDWNGTNYTHYNSSLILMFNFDNISAIGEGANNKTVDVSMYGNNGTCYQSGYGAVCNYTTGRYGKTINFSGGFHVANTTKVNGLPIGNSSRTIEAWIYRTDSSNEMGIIQYGIPTKGKMNGLIISGNNPDSLYFYGHLNDTSTNADIPLNDWVYITMTYNGTHVSLYLNGTLDISTPLTLNTTIGDGSNLFSGLTIGMRPSDPNLYWGGLIDEVRIWNTSLSSAEILQHYKSNLNKYGSENWTFVSNQTNLTTGAYDYTVYGIDGNSNTGFATNMLSINYTNISRCMVLSRNNTLYKLTTSVTAPATCMNITGLNVTLDCQSNSINYTTSGVDVGYGIITNNTYTQIKNCIINQATTKSNSWGIFYNPANQVNYLNVSILSNSTVNVKANSYPVVINRVNNAIIENNTIICKSTGCVGIIANNAKSDNITLRGNWINTSQSGISDGSTVSRGWNIYNNTFYLMGSGAVCNILQSAGDSWTMQNNHLNNEVDVYSVCITSNNTLTSNIINTKGIASNYALRLTANGAGNQIKNNLFNISGSGIGFAGAISNNNNYFENNTIIQKGTGKTGSYGIGFQSGTGATNNTFLNNNILMVTSSSYGVYVSTSNNNWSFTGGSINSTSDSDIYIGLVNGGFWNFTNVTHSDRTYYSGANGSLFVNWYAIINITNMTYDPIASAQVVMNNTNNQMIINETTGANGLTSEYFVTEVNMTTSSSPSNNPFKILINKTGLPTIYRQRNIDHTGQYNIIVDDFPSINFTFPTPSNNTAVNDTYAVVNISSSDNIGNHSVILDWNKTLVGWWRFNQEFGDTDTLVLDKSSYGNNATCSGTACPTFTTSGKWGGAYSFDGSDLFNASNSSSLNFNNQSVFTFSAWINPSDANEAGYIFSKANGSTDIGFGFYFDGTIDRIWLLNGASSSSPSVSSNAVFTESNTWSFATIVLNSSNIIYYKNGAFAGNGNNQYTFISSPTNLIIGNRFGAATTATYFNGSIDDVQIYSRALTAQEINASYNAQLYQYLNNFTNLTNGTYTIQAYAQDLAGNINQTELRSFNVSYSPAGGDTTPPSFSSNETNATPAINGYLRMNITINDTNADSYKFFWNNTGTLTNDSALTYTSGVPVSTAKQTATAHQRICWGYWANDTLGNVNTSSLSCFTVENTIPDTPSIQYPQQGINYTDIPYINYSSSDADSDTLTYQIYINGTLNTTLTSNLTDWNASDGYYRLEVSAYDSFDYSANSTAVFFRLDTTPPAYTNFQNNASTITMKSGAVNWSITLTDNGELSTYKFAHNQSGSLTNSTLNIISGASAFVNYTLAVTLARDNYICGQFWLNDTLGNYNQTNMSCFTTINSPPAQPNILYPVNNSVIEALNISLSISSSDIDGDSITYRHFINLTLNSTSINSNSSFNSSSYGYFRYDAYGDDGINMSINATIFFNLSSDVTLPILNCSILNKAVEWGEVNCTANEAILLWQFSIRDNLTNESYMIFDNRTLGIRKFLGLKPSKKYQIEINATDLLSNKRTEYIGLKTKTGGEDMEIAIAIVLSSFAIICMALGIFLYLKFKE